MKKNLVKGLALVAVSVLGVTGLSLDPANATAANKTVIVQEGNTLSGLNTGVNGKNLVTNVDVLTPTGAGFTYFNNKAQLIRNTAFGTFKITRNNCGTATTQAQLDAQFGCFQVTYTVKKGLKYSDGTLITAQDLLLSHALSSSDYSIKAGLGDPMSGAAFNSAGYGGAYDSHTRAESFNLSDDNFSLTVKYDAFQPDWQIFGPGPGAVHALVGLAKGKKSLQSVRTNAIYKSAFEDAYYDAIDSTGNLVNVPATGLADVDAIYLPTLKANLLEKGDKVFGTGLLRSGSVVDKIEPSTSGTLSADVKDSSANITVRAASGKTFRVPSASAIYANMSVSIPKVVTTAGFADAVAGSNTIVLKKSDGTPVTAALYVGDTVKATVLDPSKDKAATGNTPAVIGTSSFTTTITAISGNTLTLANPLPAGSTNTGQAFSVVATYSVSGTVASVDYDANTVTLDTTGTNLTFSTRTTWGGLQYSANSEGTGLVTLDDPNIKAVSGSVRTSSTAQQNARALMKQMAAKWSTAWNITTVNSSTNPLLLISNGTFMLQSCGASSCTLVKNPNGAIGGAPKQTGNLDVMIFKFPATGTSFSDAAVGQAMKNGEVDLYSGSATSTFYSTVSSDPTITMNTGSVATYEHLDLRSGPSIDQNESNNSYCSSKTTYDGPWAGNSTRAKELRKAFLLTVPRQVIANTYIGKVFDPAFTGNSPVLNSLFSLTTEGDYAKVVAGSSAYNADFITKDQAARNALALTLVRKYYPSAGDGTNTIDVKYLASTADRRVDIRTQIQLQSAKVGFNVIPTHTTSWPNYLNCNDYDVYDFAWSKSAISQTGTNPQYQSTGGNNAAGWNDPALDSALAVFEGNLSATQIISAKIAAEKALWSNYYSLPLYQWPGMAAWNRDLKGVLPSPLNPNVVWNYWQLGF